MALSRDNAVEGDPLASLLHYLVTLFEISGQGARARTRGHTPSIKVLVKPMKCNMWVLRLATLLCVGLNMSLRVTAKRLSPIKQWKEPKDSLSNKPG